MWQATPARANKRRLDADPIKCNGRRHVRDAAAHHQRALISDINVVEPDLLFVPEDRQSILTEKNIQGAPALVVEVVSNPRMDRVRKRDLYARFGVPQYWVVDPEADRVEVYRLAGESYAKPEILEPGETLTYDGLPGLAIDLTELFAR